MLEEILMIYEDKQKNIIIKSINKTVYTKFDGYKLRTLYEIRFCYKGKDGHLLIYLSEEIIDKKSLLYPFIVDKCYSWVKKNIEDKK